MKGSGEVPASIEAESTLGLESGLGYMFRVRVQLRVRDKVILVHESKGG